MENQVAIEVKNVTKSFKVYYDKGKELKEKASRYLHQIGSKSEDVINSAKEKVMNAGTKAADKVSNDTFKVAEKADEIKNKVHNFADNAKK